MLTRCPQCATTFRVTPEQLKVRQGRVRCGECQEVFNALDTLIEETPKVVVHHQEASAAPPPAPSPDAGDAIPAEPPRPELSDEEPETGPSGEPAADAAPEPRADMAQEADTEQPSPSEPPPAPLPEASDQEAPPLPAPEEILVPGPLPGQYAPANENWILENPPRDESTPPDPGSAGEADALPSEPPMPTTAFEPLLHEPPRRAAWPWAIGTAIGLLAMVIQFAVYLRTEIATLYPEAKPALGSLCEAVGCDLPLPRKAELVGIETSDLHPEQGNGGRLAMAALLKNRAPFAQEFPHLELTLTDVADKALVRRVLAPADYLPPKADRAAGLAAGGELNVNLIIEAPGVPAAGYRLYLFYP